MKNLFWEVEVYDVIQGKNIVEERFDSYLDAKSLYEENMEKYGDSFDHLLMFYTKMKGRDTN